MIHEIQEASCRESQLGKVIVLLQYSVDDLSAFPD